MARGIPRCASQYSHNGPSLCEAMCISGWDEERDKEDTATSMGSLLPLETLGGAGSCGVHQECASPRQGMLHAAAPPGLRYPLISGNRGWSQTTWEKFHQATCSQIRQRRTQKQVFLELGPRQGGTVDSSSSRSVDLNLSGLHSQDSEVLTSNFEVSLSISKPRCAIGSSMHLSLPQREPGTLGSVW